jgi:hypothetical protein
MLNSIKYKVPNGKLLEVRVDYDSSFRKVEILGDFFIYPEEGLKAIEDLLVGMDIGEKEEAISDRIGNIVDSNGITLVGLTPEAIAKSIVEAVGK